MFGAARWRFRPEQFILCGILLVAAGLIFFRLTRADVQTDAGHYALRAVGYLDFLDSMRQTTPLQWFAPHPPPAWTKLSFHDHPPLVFGIQHLFFRAFGVNDSVALLPFALSGVLSVLLLYGIGHRVGGAKVGLLAAGFLAVATFFTWSSRIGYLEGVEQLFILLAVWLWLKAESHPRWLPVWGVSLGLAVQTKYSALFLVPVFCALLLWRRRSWIGDRRFWLAIALAAVVLSPLAYYNARLWAARGHLDVQLSTVVKSALPAAGRDWPLLFNSPRSRNIPVNLRDLGVTLLGAFSLPFALLLVVGAAAAAGHVVFGSRRNRDVLPTLTLLSLTAFFALTAPSLRYLPIMVPWLALAAAVVAARALRPSPARWSARAAVTAGVLIVVVGVELLFNWNTNLAAAAVGRRGRHFAAYRQERLGFQELEAFLRPLLASSPTFRQAIRPPRSFTEWHELRLQPGEDVLLYDDGLLWFSAFWYLRRYRVYHQVDALLVPTDVAAGLGDDWLRRMLQAGIRTAYVVVGENPAVYDPWAAKEGDQLASKQIGRQLQQLLDQGAPGRVVPIATADGQPAFRVYALFLNPALPDQPGASSTPTTL